MYLIIHAKEKIKNKEKIKRNRCCLKIKQLIEEGEINKFENYTR
jgi:hypothetical protein